MSNKALRKYVEERDASLLSLDKDKIQRFLRKYGVDYPKNETTFWAGVHKSILHINAANGEQRLNSFIWLLEHGFSPDIR